MTLETEYNPGDEVYFFYDNKVQKSEVLSVIVTKSKNTNPLEQVKVRCSRKERLGGTSVFNETFQATQVFRTLEGIEKKMTDIENIIDHLLDEKRQ